MVYRGVCFKILDALAKEVGFSYSINIEAKASGSINLTSGDWTGMIGDLASNRTDMAIYLLTENARRREAS